MTDADKLAILDHQLSMSEVTWQQMLQLGFTTEKSTALDFFYECPTLGKAEALRTFLLAEVGYESRAHAHADEWKLTGKTPQTQLTLEIIQEWIEWMVLAGFEYDSRFDGWGAEIPR